MRAADWPRRRGDTRHTTHRSRTTHNHPADIRCRRKVRKNVIMVGTPGGERQMMSKSTELVPATRPASSRQQETGESNSPTLRLYKPLVAVAF